MKLFGRWLINNVGDLSSLYNSLSTSILALDEDDSRTKYWITDDENECVYVIWGQRWLEVFLSLCCWLLLVYDKTMNGFCLLAAEGKADDLFIPNTINGILVKDIYGEEYYEGCNSFNRIDYFT